MSASTRLRLVGWILVATCGIAARGEATELMAGAKVGWTGADLAGDMDAGTKMTNSWLIGFLGGWEIKPWFSVQFEPGFTHKGAELEDFDFGQLATKVVLDYFEIPVLAKFKFPLPDTTRQGPFATVGPVFSINTNANLDVAAGDENIGQYVEDFDFGIGLGLGYDVVIGTGVTSIEVRYVYGFTNVFKSNTPNPAATGDLANRALQISVGWYVPAF